MAAKPLRARLLREATEILARDGFVGLTVRRVAEAAGCSTIGIYTHFRDKRGLVEAVLLDAFADFEASIAVVDRLPPGRQQLIAGGHAYRDWALANRSRYLVMFASYEPDFTPSPEAGRRMERSLRMHEARVAAAMAAGELADGDTEQVAYHIWACVHGHVTLDLYFGRFGPEHRAAFEAAYGRILDGVTPR